MLPHEFNSNGIDDPAFVGLAKELERYESYEVLRYRPGKRITIAAWDCRRGPVIVKYLATGAAEVFDRLCAVWRARIELGFDVSQPLQYRADSNCFVQECLDGKEVRDADLPLANTVVRAMARAIKTLHGSSASFDSHFDARLQRVRSDRYVHLIRKRFPGIEHELNRIQKRLCQLEQHVCRYRKRLLPIHGSLHSHQWLGNNGRLALVDFDRGAMGHPELDIATFLAEFDYEPPAIGLQVNRTFLAEFDDYDPQTLLFYRAHKHLAKAFKASKTTRPDIALSKTCRNLSRTAALLANAQVCRS